MSRRKQTKPQHLQSDSDEELKDGKVKKDASKAVPDLEGPSHCTPVQSTGTVTTAEDAKAPTQGTQLSQDSNSGSNVADSRTGSVQETTCSKDEEPSQVESQAKGSTPDVTLAKSHSVGDASNPAASVVVKRKRGRPPSLHLQKSAGAKLPSPTSLSPRRQSLRLQRSRGRRPMTAEAARDKMSHRTCQYCGVVKPTPAALLRHIRKHTGERPFICQVCNKCYKAKRSLHLHQLSHHHELFERNPCNTIDPNNPAIAVSPSTTNLLRETLETRRLARLSESCDPYSGPGLGEGAVVDSVGGHSTTVYRHSSPVLSKSSLVNGESQTPADHKDSVKMTEGEEADDEEGLDDLTKRSCPYCFKVCPKPSDLKRHLMVHTGERPFRCQVCHKCFKQKGSLLYHQKAAHDLNVELSQGLEERYLRLKTRSALRSLAALDGLNQQHAMDGFTSFAYGSQDSLLAAGDCSGESLEEDNGGKHLPHHFGTRNHSAQVAGSSLPDKHPDLYSQTSKLRNGLLEEEVISGSRIVEIEMLDAKDANMKQCRRQRLLVTKETLLISQLDGICLSTGQEETVFKCCICGKVFTSLAQTHSHISSHFDLAGMTFDCHLCSAVFMCKSDVVEHMQVQHGTDLKDMGIGGSSCDFSIVNRSRQLEDEFVCEYQRSMKHFAGFDDHNNNNDKLRDKERLTDLHEDDDIGSDLPVFPSPVVAGAPKEENSDEHARAFPAHCCTVCRKGFTSQYLLQRHMHLHFQQSAYHTAALSAVSGFAAAIGTNGLHQDLLEAALGMSYLGNDREMEEGGDKRATEEHKEEEGSLDHNKSVQNETEGRSVACREKGPGTSLENEDIKDDIMIVIPSDPDVDTSEMSEFPAVGDDGSSDHESPEKEVEIRSAPKRSLLPVKKDGPVSKSRRKSSLPTRFDHKIRSIATSSNPLMPPVPGSPTPQSLSASPHLFPSQMLLGTSLHMPLGASAEAADMVPDGHPPSAPSPHLSCPSDDDTWIGKDRGCGSKEDSLLAKQTKYVQSLHASYGHAGFRGNGFPSPSPEAAAAGLVGSFASLGLPGQQPVSVQVPTATSTPLQGVSSPPTHTLGSRADKEQQAESLSLSSGNHVSPSSPPPSSSRSPASAQPSPEDQEDLVGYPRVLWLPSMGTKSPRGSPSPPNLPLALPSSSSAGRKRIPPGSSSRSSAPALPSPDEQEGLVGYPRVLWLPSMGSRSPHGSPSPPSIPLTLPSGSSAGGKRMQPVWHTLSSDDLRNAPNTDGRKVTSLSRTHSR